MNKIRYKKLKPGEIIPLTCDFMFTEIFNNEKNMDIIESFISSYFGIGIKDIKGNIKIMSRNLGIENKKEKNKQIDLLLDYKGNKINIELNNEGPKGKEERNTVYASKVHSRNLKYGERNYVNISKTLQINLNNYSCNEDRLIENYYLRNEKGKKLTEKLQIDIVDMEKAKDICYNAHNEREKRIQKWCLALQSKTLLELKKNLGEDIMSKETKEKLVEKVEELSEDEELICLYTELSDRELTYNTMLYEETEKAKKIATKEGLEEGRRQGREQGIKEGIKEGIEQGSKENSISIAKSMLEKNMDINLISELTKLSIEELEELK